MGALATNFERIEEIREENRRKLNENRGLKWCDTTYPWEKIYAPAPEVQEKPACRR